VSTYRRPTSQDHEHNKAKNACIMVSVQVVVEKKKYMMVRMGKLVALSILDDEGSTLEVNRMARREEKADNEISMWESYASRLQEII